VIAALRRRHLLIWGALALAAPVVLIAALSLRATRPEERGPLTGRDLSRIDAAQSPAGPEDRASHADHTADVPDLSAAPLFAGQPLHVRVRIATDGTRWLEAQPSEPLLEPEVLVYVLATASRVAAPTGDTALPAGARLLGALSGTLARRWSLPADVDQLLLYSLGHQGVLARGALPAASAPSANGAR
jgi:hypothetical protein